MSTTHSTNTRPVPEGLDHAMLLRLYEQMVLVRRFERTVQTLYRDGELPGFIHLYVGEEATGVGVIAQLRPDDWITSTHRGHGHVLAKGVPPQILLAELAGKATGCCGGRGGTMHLYAPSLGLFGTNGIVGAGIPAAVGLGLSAMTRGTDQVAVALFGDGAVNHGAFHESVNFAGIQNAPVVFVCENNLYATATPLTMTTRNVDIASKAAAYGVPGVAVDGNDVLAVWEVAGEAIRRARAGEGPTLIESRTYRMVGHHEGDPLVGTYRTQEEMDAWALRCPILRLRELLVETGQASAEELDAIDARIDQQIQEAVDFARSSPMPDPATATRHTWAEPVHPPLPGPAAAGERETVVQGWMEAVCDGIAEEMRRDPHILYLGEGIGERGGTFGHSKGLYEEFGPRRLIDTPICELGFTGASIGTSGTGCRTVADLMISDLLWEAGSQIVLQAARLRYMSNGQISVPMIVRSGMGTVKNAGPHHSGTYHAVWAHCPGLIVVVPSNPADAKGLFKTALRASDPVIFLEHKSLLSTKGPVPVGEHFVPFGQASVVREGSDLTIVSCGLWLHRSMEAAQRLAEENVSCAVIDLRTIVPLDVETIVASVAKTGRILVVDEGHAACGLGAEIAAVLMEHAFDELDAPVGRLHTDPVPAPFSPVLENAVMASVDRIVAAARAVLEGRPIPARRAVGPRSAASTPDGRPHVQTRPEAVQASKPDVARRAASTGVPFVVPNMDLTITEVTVVQWLKKIGDTIRAGEGVVEVETDKAVLEVESPIDGTLVEMLADQGSTVSLGARLGTIQPI
ncbi:MAG: pyruvate dehydrogenase complex E1 component subunit beta [Planctomycetota bacterium]